MPEMPGTARTVRSGSSALDRRFQKSGADIRADRAAKVVRELVPFRDRHGEEEPCMRYFESNFGRMPHDGFRERGIRVGSGVVGADAGRSGCGRGAPAPAGRKGAPASCRR